MSSKKKIYPAEKQWVTKDNHVLTVWKRSSMSFQGTDGFTVFDAHGILVFRVDNYSRKKPFPLLLMDGLGNALLTFKPQVMSMKHQWNAYFKDAKGEYGRSKVFSMRSASNTGFYKHGKQTAEIFMGGISRKTNREADFRIEGSFQTRDCKIKSCNGEVVAVMARKRVNSTVLLSDDVFSLFIQPGFDSQLVMAFIIVLDRISNHPFAPLLCS